MNRVTFGPASWIGLIGALAAACAPVFSALPATWGATVAAVLAALVVIGRQMQALALTRYGAEQYVGVGDVLDELPLSPTDTQA